MFGRFLFGVLSGTALVVCGMVLAAALFPLSAPDLAASTPDPAGPATEAVDPVVPEAAAEVSEVAPVATTIPEDPDAPAVEAEAAETAEPPVTEAPPVSEPTPALETPEVAAVQPPAETLTEPLAETADVSPTPEVTEATPEAAADAPSVVAEVPAGTPIELAPTPEAETALPPPETAVGPESTPSTDVEAELAATTDDAGIPKAEAETSVAIDGAQVPDGAAETAVATDEAPVPDGAAEAADATDEAPVPDGEVATAVVTEVPPTPSVEADTGVVTDEAPVPAETATTEAVIEPAPAPTEVPPDAQPEPTPEPLPELATLPQIVDTPPADPSPDLQPLPVPEIVADAEVVPELDPAALPDPNRTEDGIIIGRLPRIGDAPAEAPPPPGTPVAGTPLSDFAVAFQNPDKKPVFAIVLIDPGTTDLDRAGLAALPFPVSFALDPLDPATPERVAIYRAGGKEVVMLATGIAEGSQASDIEVAFQSMAQGLPEAVAVMDIDGTLFQNNRPVATLVVPVIEAQGRGLLTWDVGLNAADQVARREDVPAAVVFRDLAASGDDGAAIQRILGRAIFKAGQDGRVAVAATASPGVVAALLEWTVEGKAASVALAPVSAVLTVE